jgi:FtsH-binding integral membrane protein
MALGLAVSGLVAYWTAITPTVFNVVLGNQAVFFLLIIIELVLVVSLSWLIQRLSAVAATLLFLIYAIVNGLTLSVVVIAYTDASLASTFAIAAGMFGAMALYGYATGRDLSRLGSIMFMGLIGLIIAGVVNIFINSNGLNLAISVIGIIIFTGLTAYDVQKIKNFGLAADDATGSKQAIFGALMLYLDFINIFLSLLNLTGRRRK